MKILHVVGARPNFMKAAPVIRAISARGCQQLLIHTGQHYDVNMSDIFFQQLGLPPPDINLEVGSSTHSVQTAQVMLRFEEIALREKPDVTLVYGDVNSTIAVALVCAKLLIPVAHVEAGLRSFDRTMPEEINRILTDQIADLLFTPSLDGNKNLACEGVDAAKVHFVGNVMIDTLIRLLPKAQEVTPDFLPPQFALATLHRPSNVDSEAMLTTIMNTLMVISQKLPVVFPIHPRTKQRLQSLDLKLPNQHDLILINPLGYLEFVAAQSRATVVITDSGGVQEETSYLRIPCLTLRDNTERPITVTHGTNVLVGQDMNRLQNEVEAVLNGQQKAAQALPLWDGKASERIADILVNWH